MWYALSNFHAGLPYYYLIETHIEKDISNILHLDRIETKKKTNG